MSQTASIPWLEAETIQAAMELQDERDTNPTVVNLFKPELFEGARLSIPQIIQDPSRVRHTTSGGRAMPVNRETIVLHEYETSWIKLVDDITPDDKAKFISALSAPRQDGFDVIKMRMARADEITNRIAARFRKNLAIERRALCSGALQGTYTYTLGDQGTAKSVNLALTALTAPDKDWDDPDATIVTDIADAITEFKDSNESGAPPTHVFYNPEMIRSYFLGNTQFNAMIAGSARLSEWFVGLGAQNNWMDMEGRILDPLWGLTWVPVEGTQKLLDGSSEDVYPTHTITFARLSTVPDDGADPTWLVKFDQEQTPTEQPKIEVAVPAMGAEVKNHKVVLFSNGLPMFKRPDLVCTLRVVAA